MNMHTPETQTEPEAQTYGSTPDPASVIEKEAVPAPQFTTEKEILQAFDRIKEKDAERLLQMDFEEVLALLRAESRKRTRLLRFRGGIVGTVILLFLVVALLKHNWSIFHNLSYFTGAVTSGYVVSRKHKAAALAISQFDDIRAIGPLAETLELKDKNVQSIAAQSLICLLPRLKASDAPLLSPAQRAALNRTLDAGKNTDLTLAILKAWEQVGDAKAIPMVEQLTQGWGPGSQNPEVMTAAQECLPFLRQSAERQQVGMQLLRPSDGNFTSSDVLLRPALPHASTDPSGELLRPTKNAS